jgi:hypothetical protein
LKSKLHWTLNTHLHVHNRKGVCVMVFNVTFSNISVILWLSFIGGGNHRTATSRWQTSSHNVVHFAWAGFELTTLVVVDTDCIYSYKSNYHTWPRQPLNNHVRDAGWGEPLVFETNKFLKQETWLEFSLKGHVSIHQ